MHSKMSYGTLCLQVVSHFFTDEDTVIIRLKDFDSNTILSEKSRREDYPLSVGITFGLQRSEGKSSSSVVYDGEPV
jgi:hypothetical protein